MRKSAFLHHLLLIMFCADICGERDLGRRPLPREQLKQSTIENTRPHTNHPQKSKGTQNWKRLLIILYSREYKVEGSSPDHFQPITIINQSYPIPEVSAKMCGAATTIPQTPSIIILSQSARLSLEGHASSGGISTSCGHLDWNTSSERSGAWKGLLVGCSCGRGKR